MDLNFDFTLRTNVKRIVVTSSCAAISTTRPPPAKFSDKDWNTTSPKEVEEQGDKAAPGLVYRASKTLAEKGRHIVRVCSSFSLLDVHGIFF